MHLEQSQTSTQEIAASSQDVALSPFISFLYRSVDGELQMHASEGPFSVVITAETTAQLGAAIQHFKQITGNLQSSPANGRPAPPPQHEQPGSNQQSVAAGDQKNLSRKQKRALAKQATITAAVSRLPILSTQPTSNAIGMHGIAGGQQGPEMDHHPIQNGCPANEQLPDPFQGLTKKQRNRLTKAAIKQQQQQQQQQQLQAEMKGMQGQLPADMGMQGQIPAQAGEAGSSSGNQQNGSVAGMSMGMSMGMATGVDPQTNLGMWCSGPIPFHSFLPDPLMQPASAPLGTMQASASMASMPDSQSPWGNAPYQQAGMGNGLTTPGQAFRPISEQHSQAYPLHAGMTSEMHGASGVWGRMGTLQRFHPQHQISGLQHHQGFSSVALPGFAGIHSNAPFMQPGRAQFSDLAAPSAGPQSTKSTTLHEGSKQAAKRSRQEARVALRSTPEVTKKQSKKLIKKARKQLAAQQAAAQEADDEEAAVMGTIADHPHSSQSQSEEDEPGRDADMLRWLRTTELPSWWTIPSPHSTETAHKASSDKKTSSEPALDLSHDAAKNAETPHSAGEQHPADERSDRDSMLRQEQAHEGADMHEDETMYYVPYRDDSPPEEPTDLRPLLLFDLNGTLTAHTSARKSSGKNEMRPGISHLRRLQVCHTVLNK